MTAGTYRDRLHSEFAITHYDRGEAAGKAAGEVAGEAKMLLLVLKSRGIQVSDEARTRILECADTAQLEAWGARAHEIAAVDELFT